LFEQVLDLLFSDDNVIRVGMTAVVMLVAMLLERRAR
jgi:hypothetical protein